MLVNGPVQILQLHMHQALEGLSCEALEHDTLHLLLAIFLLLVLELLLNFPNPFSQIGILVKHLLALVHGRHAIEPCKDALDSLRGRPDLWLGVIGAVDYSTSINITKSGEFTHLLHKTLLPLLECLFASTVISDVGQFHLLSCHGYQEMMKMLLEDGNEK